MLKYLCRALESYCRLLQEQATIQLLTFDDWGITPHNTGGRLTRVDVAP